MFQSSIDEQNLPAVSKFRYFKGLLKESALSAVQGITIENYEVVIKLLKDRFGRKEVIVESLYSKLQNLPKSGGKFREIQYVCETIEKLLRQLEAQGELINDQRTLIQQIISKSNPKQPSCKKKCAALKKAMVKKDMKSKVAAKKWL